MMHSDGDGTMLINDIKSNTDLKQISIENRRYLGNKQRMLNELTRIINTECPGVEVVMDVFSGTGVVANAFNDKTVITNDLLYSNYICHYAWFSSDEINSQKIKNIIATYNKLEVVENNYFSENFANTYFSESVCKKIGYIREDIERLSKENYVNERERAILIMSLLYSMDRIANTCGHYDAYRKNVKFVKDLELYYPNVPLKNSERNIILNMNANQLVREISADLVYIDPPYNSRQYSDAYHLLENVAKWEKPEVFGVARKMKRDHIKSDYCTTKAVSAFKDLIENINSKYIVMSYNNMANKGNSRSNARISDDEIMNILEAKGEVKVYSVDFQAFTTGKTRLDNHQERLFICKVSNFGQNKKDIVNSPLNYIGGKYKLLPQLLPHFPDRIDKFIDLCCGGGSVGINIECEKLIMNDIQSSVIGILNLFKSTPKIDLLSKINQVIDEFELSRSQLNGYEYYGCNSKIGLGPYNKEKYLRLREKFNSLKPTDKDYYFLLYVLIIYGFNNQIRFNRNLQFNLPVGKRDFNMNMVKKFNKFIERIQSVNCQLLNKDFRIALEGIDLTKDSLVYVDPPYLITCATYNENGGWTEQDERDLLNLLDKLHAQGIRFALSNVLRSKGKENTILIDWLNSNKERYNIIYLDYSYSNSNYQVKDRQSKSEEVLITNYTSDLGTTHK